MLLDKHILVTETGVRLVGYCRPQLSEVVRNSSERLMVKIQMCDVVFNPNTQQVRKCRIGLESLFDLLLNNKEETT